MLRQAVVIRRFAALLALGGAALSGCTTNHDALARKPPTGGSGGGGSGGGGAGGVMSSAGQGGSGGRLNPDIEAAGDNVLTIVNGIVDAESVRLCFARVTYDGATSELQSDPQPELGYAAGTVVSELADLSFSDDAIEPWVIAGDLSLIDGLNCQDAIALAESEEASVTPDPDAEPPAKLKEPKLRARSLAVLPAGTVDIGRSLLLVLSGCIGGAYYTDELETTLCGDDYTPSSPTLQPIIVKLSRSARAAAVGLQGLHASLSTASLDVRAADKASTVARVFASGIGYGAIEPRPADTRFSPSELGTDAGDYGLQAVGERGDVVFQELWNDVLSASGLPSIQLGRTYTAIFIGPNPVVQRPGWWNAPAFTLVDNDPTRAQ